MDKNIEIDSIEITLEEPLVAVVKATSIQTPRQLLALFKVCRMEISFSQERVDEIIELGFEHLLEYTEKK